MFAIRRWPSSQGANSRSQKAIVLGGIELIEAGGAPVRLGGFDDEGRCVVIEAIGVRLEPAVLGLDEDESERLEHPMRAEPDELVASDVDLRLEMRGVTVRILLLMPSAATIRSASGNAATSSTSRWKTSSTPRCSGAALQDVQ